MGLSVQPRFSGFYPTSVPAQPLTRFWWRLLEALAEDRASVDSGKVGLAGAYELSGHAAAQPGTLLLKVRVWDVRTERRSALRRGRGRLEPNGWQGMDR